MSIQTSDIRSTCCILFTLIGAFVLAGCSSTNSLERSEDTRTSMAALEKEVEASILQLDATETALRNLMRPGQANLKQAFESFSENVSEMVSLEESFSSHAERMQERGSDYFSEWEQSGDSYENEQIRQLSEQRRQKLQRVFERVVENTTGVSGNFEKYVSNLQEIRRYLSNDLTTQGVQGIQPVAEEVAEEGKQLQNGLQNVQEAIRQARDEMSQGE